MRTKSAPQVHFLCCGAGGALGLGCDFCMVGGSSFMRDLVENALTSGRVLFVGAGLLGRAFQMDRLGQVVIALRQRFG